MGVQVISLFDGISVGYSALIREGFAIEKYYASEIDRFAIAVSAANHPDIVQVGCIKALDTRALAELLPAALGLVDFGNPIWTRPNDLG